MYALLSPQSLSHLPWDVLPGAVAAICVGEYGQASRLKPMF